MSLLRQRRIVRCYISRRVVGKVKLGQGVVALILVQLLGDPSGGIVGSGFYGAVRALGLGQAVPVVNCIVISALTAVLSRFFSAPAGIKRV